MDKQELYELLLSISTGVKTLHELSDAGGDDTSRNYARILFYALGAYLLEDGVLESLARCGYFMRDAGGGELYEESV